MRAAAGPCLWIVVVTSACGGESSVEEAESGTQTSSASNDAAASSTSSTSSASEDEAGSTGGATATPEFARHVRLLHLTANQGVQRVLVRDGLEVPEADETVRLVSGRRTLIRGHWSLHADFVPRELVARLTIDYADGAQLVRDVDTWVEAESKDGGVAFDWLLEPHEVQPGMRYRVQVLEPDPTVAKGEVSDPPPIAPLAGPGTLQLHDTPLQLEVVLVPVMHRLGECESTPAITEADVDAMRRELEQNNPVQQAVLTVRDEPMLYTETIGEAASFSPVLAALAQTRAADDPNENVYYYGLLEPCDGFPPGLGGQAIGIPDAPTKGNAQQRIAAGRWLGSGAAAASIFVHEIGHCQGRYHVRCSGGEAGTDSLYPHGGGRIGRWGFGIYDFKLRSPTSARDYMTYCANEWVSDYGWEQTLQTIETLTSWNGESAPATDARVLVGVLHEDGTDTWWTARGEAPSPSSAHARTVRFERDGELVTQPAQVSELPDGRGAWLVVTALPRDFDRVRRFTLEAHEQRTVDAARVKLIAPSH